MVVALWEVVKFLWSHPIISCLVLLLFSPPFFPIIVYFSPVLLCTGLVAIAMVSMSVGESAQSEDWRNGIGRLYEPGVHHRVEAPVKPAQGRWLEWMKKTEEKAKAWVDSRFLNQDKWHFQNTSVLAPEEEPDLVVDNNEGHVGYQIPSYKAPTPNIEQRGHILSPLEANRDVLPHLAEVAKVSNDGAYSSEPAAENIKPISRAHVGVEDSPIAFSNLSLATLEVPLAALVEEEVVTGKIVTPSALEEFKDFVEREILSVAPKAGSLLEEQSVSKCNSEPRALDEGVIEVPLIPSHKGVTSLVSISESFRKILEKRTHERRAEALESIASEESNAFVLASDQVTTVELIAGNWKVSGDLGIPVSSVEAVQKVVKEKARNFQTSAPLQGRRLATEEVLVSPEFSVLGQDPKASPEAEGETHTGVFSHSNQQDVVDQPTQRFIATEKIIFVDEPSKFTRVQSRSMVAETASQMEAIEKAIGQITLVETKLHEKIDLTEEDSKSPKDGLDENIESHENFLPASTTSAAVLVQRNPDAMALVKSQSISEEEILPESSSRALVRSIPHHPTDLELLAEQMEPMMALISNDVAAERTSFRGSVLDKSYSSNSTFNGEREEYDDLTVRFNALKKSMSLHTTRRGEEPIPTSLRTTNRATANAIVPVYIPDMVSIVEREKQFLESNLVSPEKKKPLTQPRLSSEDVESLESLTARLQKKFTLNLRNDVPISSPPSRPVPALPSIAAAPTSVESDKSVASAESDKSGEVTGSLVLPIDADPVKSKLKNSHSKKSLTSFLSRRRERLLSSQLVDPFSISGEEEKGGSNISSGTTADTVTSAETGAENRDEGSTTSGRHLKEKMISPLKRVFSMDANAGSSRKVEVGGVLSVRSSPVKEKQSVIDRSKGRLMKLFSNEGGLTNVELAGSDAASFEKSKSVSQKSGDQNVELTEDHDGVVENAMSLPTKPKFAPSVIPSEVAHGVENEDVKSGRQEELPSIAAEAPSAETVEDLDRITKSSSDKKFKWSWRNSQKFVAREKTGEQSEVGQTAMSMPTTPESAASLNPTEVVLGNVELVGEQNELGQTAMSMQRTPEFAASSSPTEVVHGNVELVGEQNELGQTAMSMPTTPELAAFSSPTEVVFGNVELVGEQNELGQTAMSMPTTPELAASSSPTEVVFGNVELVGEQNELGQTAMSMPPTPELAASSSPTEVVHGIVENMDVESEKEELPGIEASVALLETAEGLDNLLEPIPSSPTALPSTPETKEPGDGSKLRGREVPKSSSEKKFGWTWKKKKQFSEPLDDAQPMMDQFRSQDAISLSANGVVEVGHGIENVVVKTENRQLPSIDEAAEPVAETTERMQPLTLDIMGQEDAAEVRRGRVTTPSSEKKFEWSWTKKKRSSEPIDDAPAMVNQFRSQDDSAIPVSRTGMLDESREIIMSPLTRFHSSSAIMSPVRENSRVDVPVPWDENDSSELRFSPRPDANSSHRGSPKANSSPFKRSSISWLSSKTGHSKIDHPVVEKVPPAEKKVSTSWWPRKHKRADSKAVSSSSANISSPTEDSISAVPCERSGPTVALDNINIHNSVVGNSNRLQNDIILEGDDELIVEVPPRRARHRRERSDSLPTISSGGKFTRLHWRQSSMSEITLPRTPELSPRSSSRRATDYNSSTSTISSSTSFSMPRTEDGHHPELVKRNSDSNSVRSSTTSVSTTPLPTSSYPMRPSAVRMLDLANEQLKGGSPFHRSDLDVSGSRGHYRSSPSAAEIRITDKLKAPLEEILSLLAIGENDEQHRLTTVDRNCTGGAIGGGDCLRQAASSSSSSENETSSEEEWSAKSDNEDESQEQQQEQQQFTLLPPSGRIRRRLPPYIFSREEEPTAN